MVKILLGNWKDSLSAASYMAYLTEFLSTFLFVFASVGSAMAYGTLSSRSPDASGLVAVALSHAMALSVAVAAAAPTSGGHINPAVTFALALGGHITILTGTLYWVAQFLGAIIASLFLRLTTGRHHSSPPVHALGPEVSPGLGVIMEAVITFALVYTVYATAVDKRKKTAGAIAPLLIGFVVGANILATGPFTGGSMNPARSFGPAVVGGHFRDNWVYWIGPLLGGGLAGVVCNATFLRDQRPGAGSDVSD